MFYFICETKRSCDDQLIVGPNLKLDSELKSLVPYGPLTVNAVSTVDDAAMPMTPDTYSFIYESSLPKALPNTVLHTSREPTRPHSPLTGLWLSRQQMNLNECEWLP
jgi:hypothetical protein